MTAHTVFAYGTLRQGSWNHVFLQGQTLLGPGRTRDLFALYVDDVPYAAKEPLALIRGEVWAVDDACLAALDRLEGHPHEYQREQAPVVLDNGETVTAWLYFHPEPRGALIQSGDFFDDPRARM